MGRRLCEKDGNHPNNIYIDAIKPAENNGEFSCRVCEEVERAGPTTRMKRRSTSP